MLKKITTFIFLAVAVFGYSQEKHDPRLLERYTSEELTTIQNNNPEEYEILVHALKVGISIGEHEDGEGKEIVFDGEIDKDPTLDHTYISLGLDLVDGRYQYYKFKGTNFIVIVRPKNLITQIK
ncbi:MAG TPA: hypothetical protein VKY37_00775 [Brumimicrobium sp.]|nr:hypothetical protein [Brumimicrobium sp.]